MANTINEILSGFDDAGSDSENKSKSEIKEMIEDNNEALEKAEKKLKKAERKGKGTKKLKKIIKELKKEKKELKEMLEEAKRKPKKGRWDEPIIYFAKKGTDYLFDTALPQGEGEKSA